MTKPDRNDIYKLWSALGHSGGFASHCDEQGAMVVYDGLVTEVRSRILSPETLERVLIDLMSDYSEDMWAAGWLSDLEFITWRDIHNGSEDEDLQRINEVAQALGRWPVWRDFRDGGAHTIPLDEFAEMFAASRYASLEARA